ncbi:uncharacterized protein LOC129615651 isoform X2 [Condylostylus longicornis]|uniref:uncharacterized protein LOC129615651 isoform X2 n=1 Tax=Condylostylus longicornis TaxID=2530218 RepID=UPI00244DC1BC|nr:uncharacterized protein LOC129615651 isoform X2 [Condylostylus longicornis]
MFDVIRKIAWIFVIILITVAAIPEIPSKGKQLTRISDTQSANDDSMPRFAEPIPNVTVSVGRDALLACVVENLKGYKVAWVRVDTQTILSIHHNVITQNSRISLSYNDHRSWYLHIKEVEETDRGWYMCQVNTDPMRSRKGYLQVVVPPMIIESMTSNDMVVREGTNVTLMCKARGYPEPYVMWRREDGEEMNIGGENVNVVDGEILQITKVSRLHMAAYLCVASNGVPPSISKRVHLRVQFPPMLSIANQLEGAYVGQEVTLECETEAYPASINYWTTERGDMIISDTSRAGDKFETTSLTRGYQKFMKLKIRNVGPNDFGSYRCVAKNSLGETDGIIKLDEIPTPTTAIASGDSTMFNRTLGKRPHNRKFEPNAIPDYGLEEWKDGGDSNQPPSVRHPPGAFHNKASSGYSINSHYHFIPFYWLRRPFDGIKSSTLSLITTSFWWLGDIKTLKSTTIISRKNMISSTILILSPDNNSYYNIVDNNNDDIVDDKNNLEKFVEHQNNKTIQNLLQEIETEKQAEGIQKETTQNIFKENVIITPNPTAHTFEQTTTASTRNNNCDGYYCNSKEYRNVFSVEIINNNINNDTEVNIVGYKNVTSIAVDTTRTTFDKIHNTPIASTTIISTYCIDNDNIDDDFILFLIQILKRISFILCEKINFHIIKIIEFIRMNFHIFIMLALNLISVNLVKNILLVPFMIKSTEVPLFKSASFLSSPSSLSSQTSSTTTSSSTSSNVVKTSLLAINSTFKLEKIIEKDTNKRISMSTSSLLPSISTPLLLSNSIVKENFNEYNSIKSSDNSHFLNKTFNNSSRSFSRCSNNNINTIITTDTSIYEHNNIIIINDKNIFNKNNINKNISINKSYNLNESIKMSKPNILEQNIATTTRTTIKLSKISRVNR